MSYRFGSLTLAGLGVAALLAGGDVLAAVTGDKAPPAESPAAVAGGAPPAEPFLRIETGRHTATINRVSVDASGRLAATASDDKTVRLWSLPDGKPLGILRVPIGPGPEGRLYSVALTPDGKTLAASGSVGTLWDGAPSLYLFDVARQKFKGLLSRLPSEILHLAFSPDGRRLAAVFGGGAGLMVYDMSNGRVVGEDHDYGQQPANWVTFDAQGRLATAGFDGFVRLYDASVRLIAKTRLPRSGRPFSLAFSPDGGQLAVGSFDKPRVDVLSALDLKPRFAPETGDLKTGNLAAVAWLDDGKQVTLAAGGTVTDGGGNRIIRVWGNAGKGRITDIPAARDSLNQIEPIGHGEALFVSADPSWGRIDGSGKLMELTGNIANFREIFSGRFAVSDDALTLEFGIDDKGQRPMRLDLRSQSYAPAPRSDPSLARPLLEAPGLKVVGWQNSQTPMVGSRKLVLDGEERAHSLAVAPDGRSFLLGGSYWLRLFDARGTLMAKTAVPAPVVGVVINRPGTTAVAALTDGTLRWYNLGPNGQVLEERATLFVHADGQRWVAWTPEGFFDHASTGGLDLVGYHFNKGKTHTPEWVSFDQVYPIFHRADLLKMKITGGSDPEIARNFAAIGDLGSRLERLPLPGIEITDYCWTPADGTETCRPIAEIGTRGFARDTSREAGPAPGPAPDSAAGQGPAPGPATTQAPVPAPATTPAAAPAPGLSAVLPAGTTDFKLRFVVVDHGGGVGDIAVFLNGRNIDRQDVTRAFRRDLQATAGPAPAGPGQAPPGQAPPGQAPPGQAAESNGRFERVIALEPGANVIDIRAYDRARSAFSTSRRVEVTRPEPPPEAGRGATPPPPRKPNLFVLAVGINRYKSPDNVLRYAVADAESFAQVLARNNGELFQQAFVTTLNPAGEVVVAPPNGGAVAITDADATRANVVKAFAAVGQDGRLGADDVVVVYLSGHGDIDDRPDGEGSKQYYFITQEVDTSVRDQAFGQDLILQQLTPILKKTEKVFLILDTCHAGSIAGESMLNAIDNIGQAAGVSLLSAAASSETALDGYSPPGKRAEHGVFAYAVLMGLAGQAAEADDSNQHVVRINQFDLADYVRSRVADLAREVAPSHQQHASFRNLGEAHKIPLVKVER